MKAFEFDSRFNKNEIRIPPDLVGQIPEGSQARVILLIQGDEDAGWRQQGLATFAAAYADEDAVHESSIDEPLTR